MKKIIFLKIKFYSEKRIDKLKIKDTYYLHSNPTSHNDVAPSLYLFSASRDDITSATEASSIGEGEDIGKRKSEMLKKQRLIGRKLGDKKKEERFLQSLEQLMGKTLGVKGQGLKIMGSDGEYAHFFGLLKWGWRIIWPGFGMAFCLYGLCEIFVDKAR